MMVEKDADSPKKNGKAPANAITAIDKKNIILTGRSIFDLKVIQMPLFSVGKHNCSK